MDARQKQGKKEQSGGFVGRACPRPPTFSHKFGRWTIAHILNTSRTLTVANSNPLSNNSSIQTENMINKNIIPSSNDIVSGRGRGYDNLEGNKVYRKLIKSHKSAYSDPKTSRKEKSRIVLSVWAMLSNRGMRMLKTINDEEWVEMSESETKKKISHALRDAKAERKLSSQAKECLKALYQHNTMAYKQIIKSLPVPVATLSDQHLESGVKKEVGWCGVEGQEHGFHNVSASRQEAIDSFLSLDAFVSPGTNHLPAARETCIPRSVSEESDYDEVDFLLDNMITDASAEEIDSVSSEIDEYMSLALPF